jgi:hypothetical protein
MPDESPKPESPTKPASGHDPDEHASPFNPFALVMILVLVVGGWFLIQWLTSSSKLQDCIMSGRKNCAPIDDGR